MIDKTKRRQINLFEDKQGDWEYGFVEYFEDTAFGEKRIDIRRKAGATIEDDWEMKWKGQWLSMTQVSQMLNNPETDDLPKDFLFLCCAVPGAVGGALDRQDQWRTHNARQEFASSGKASVSIGRIS